MRRRERLPLDEARLLPGLRRGFMLAEQTRVLARAIIETGNAPVIADPRRAAGDPEALRGLPAVGVGMSAVRVTLRRGVSVRRPEDVIHALDRERSLTHLWNGATNGFAPQSLDGEQERAAD